MLCHVKQSKKGEESANVLRETELTCIWVVVVPTTNESVTYANRTEGAVSAVPPYTIFLPVDLSLLFLSSEKSTVLTARGVSRCCKPFAT